MNKKISNFSKIIDGFEVVNLDDEEVQKPVKDENLNIYNIFSSYYHTKIEKDKKIDYNNLYDGITQLEQKTIETCLYCARNHITSNCPYVICKKCGLRGHIFKDCKNSHSESKSKLCKSCKSASHSEFDCPAAYRKYKIKKEKMNIKKSCGNCAFEHFTNNCPLSLESSRFSVFDEKFIQSLCKKK